MAKYNCKKCGCELSHEEVQILIKEECTPDTFICDECFTMIENNNPLPDEFSDADMGL